MKKNAFIAIQLFGLMLLVSSCGSSNSTNASGVPLTGLGPVFTYNGTLLDPIGGNSYIDPATGNIVFYLGGGTYQNTANGSILFGPMPLSLGANKDVKCQSIEECADSPSYKNAVQKASAAIADLEETSGDLSNSVGGGTKDIDLQQSQADQADQASRARNFANQFQMDYGKALELTRLADQVQSLSKSNQMTGDDQQAITEKALAVSGISTVEVNQTIARVIRDGDQTAINDLLNKAATNLGMPSSAGLREQILPALGIKL